MHHSALNEYNLLISGLDAFIRKYYKNRMLRGALLASALLLALYLAVSLSEYVAWFGTRTRTVLFYAFLAGTAAILFRQVVIPFLRYLRLGKLISHEQAAVIIGSHFPEVRDKLLNTLQLQKLYELPERTLPAGRELIKAALRQKTASLRLIPFTRAIDLSANKKYLKYVAPPLLVFLFILLGAPGIFRESNIRLLRHKAAFAPPAPFGFEIASRELKAMQFEDFPLRIRIYGRELPAAVYVHYGGNRYRMEKHSRLEFGHRFRNLQDDVVFELSAEGCRSPSYRLKVLPKAVLDAFEVRLDYPSYTRRPSEKLLNTGDLTVPAGTGVNWIFHTRNTSGIRITLPDETAQAEPRGEGRFIFSRKIMSDKSYTVRPRNSISGLSDSVRYYISAIPDLPPSVQAVHYRDSLQENFIFFTGDAGDDYGISRLLFRYRMEDEKNPGKRYESAPVPVPAGVLRHPFCHTWDLRKSGIQPGGTVSCFFEVWDNDGVHGSKAARTPVFTFRTSTLAELEKKTGEEADNIQENLSGTYREAGKIQQEISRLREKMLQKKSPSWEDKNALRELMENQEKLRERISDIKNRKEQFLRQQTEYKDINEEILSKYDRLQELFDELLTDEMKEMYREMEEMLEKMNRDNLLEKLKDMEVKQEDLARQLDRMLELFKQLQFDQKLSESIDKLEKLSEQQDSLAGATQDKQNPDSELKKEQEDINSSFEDISMGMKELEDLNKSLENKHDLGNTDTARQQIGENLQKSSDQLEKGNRKKASDSQKQAAEQMDALAQSLRSMLSDMQTNQLMEDLAMVRQLLENLIRMSFLQEELIRETGGAGINDPKYKKLMQRQHALKLDAEMVKDSLFALSKRVFQLQSVVQKEVDKINLNMDKSIDALEARRTADAASRQQYVMTSVNNLALMLDELMESMQQQLANQIPGTQACQKPGSGKKSCSSLSKMQQELNRQMEQMKEGINKDGQRGGQNMSKELAQMAARQAAIRNALRQLNQQYNKDGKGSLGNLDKVLEQMDKTETELVNKQITEELIKRQKEILTRLLDAEKAEREREESPERKAESPNEYKPELPPSFEEYRKLREKQVELYKTLPPGLNAYYRQLVERYFNELRSTGAGQ